VVRHLVLNGLDAEPVPTIHQLAKFVERSEVFLDPVEIAVSPLAKAVGH
jgi:hypothetical protein